MLLLTLILTATFSLFVNSAFNSPFYSDDMCPDFAPVPNFNWKKFENIAWNVRYLDYDNGFDFYKDKKCVTDKFVLLKDSKTVLATTNSIKGGLNDTDYTYGIVDRPGVILFKHNDSLIFTDEDFRIVKTDYENYVVAISCGFSSDGEERLVTAVIYTRSPKTKLPKLFAENMEFFFQRYHLNIFFDPKSWSTCKI